MGAVNFDPAVWTRAQSIGTGVDAVIDAAKVATIAKAGRRSLSQLSQLSQAHLTDEIECGIDMLRVRSAPYSVDAGRWPRAVADAIAIFEGGWAALALALGWSPLNLFGAVIDPTGNPDADGLAVWLAGRQVFLVTENYAAARGGGSKSYYHRRSQPGATLLWNIGRERP